MGRNDETSALIDNLLRLALLGGVITAGMAAPNSLKLLKKPLYKTTKTLDDRAYKREIQRNLRYMKQNGLLKGDYEHGLQITKKGRERLQKLDNSLKSITIPKPEHWDNRWRVVVYDIPELHKVARNNLLHYLKILGFEPLQKSILVYPYECREEIEQLTARLEVDRYITYFECTYIDRQEILVDKFKSKQIM